MNTERLTRLLTELADTTNSRSTMDDCKAAIAEIERPASTSVESERTRFLKETRMMRVKAAQSWLEQTIKTLGPNPSLISIHPTQPTTDGVWRCDGCANFADYGAHSPSCSRVK